MSEPDLPFMPVTATPSAGGGRYVLRPVGPADFLFGLHGRQSSASQPDPLLQEVAIRDHVPVRPILPPILSIWHLTRCGSTLTARMLSCIEALQVTDEPGALVDICGAFWGLVPAADRLPALDMTLRSLGQRLRPGARHLVVKQSLRSGAELDLFTRLHPDMHRLLIIRDPLEILVSNLRKPPGWLKLRNAVWSPMLSGVGLATQAGLSDAEFIARCLGRAFTAMAEAVEKDSTAWLILDYTELPGAVMTRLLPRLGITPSPAECVAMEETTRLEAWNRKGRQPFRDDRADKQAAVTAEMRALCDRFLREPWQRLALLNQSQPGNRL